MRRSRQFLLYVTATGQSPEMEKERLEGVKAGQKAPGQWEELGSKARWDHSALEPLCSVLGAWLYSHIKFWKQSSRGKGEIHQHHSAQGAGCVLAQDSWAPAAAWGCIPELLEPLTKRHFLSSTGWNGLDVPSDTAQGSVKSFDIIRCQRTFNHAVFKGTLALIAAQHKSDLFLLFILESSTQAAPAVLRRCLLLFDLSPRLKLFQRNFPC